MQIQYTDEVEFSAVHYLTYLARYGNKIGWVEGASSIGIPICKKYEAEKKGAGQLYLKAIQPSSGYSPKAVYASNLWANANNVSDLTIARHETETLSGYSNIALSYLLIGGISAGTGSDPRSGYKVYTLFYRLTGST